MEDRLELATFNLRGNVEYWRLLEVRDAGAAVGELVGVIT